MEISKCYKSQLFASEAVARYSSAHPCSYSTSEGLKICIYENRIMKLIKNWKK
jgi:hypothetical protein